MDKIIKSTCILCGAGCGILVHLNGEEITKIEGNPDHPANLGKMCALGRASLELVDHPDRLRYPLKRMGQRGEGKWQRVTWDEALVTIAAALNKTKKQDGPASVAFIQGSAKGYGDSFLARLANVFGSPNIASMSYICFHARMRGMVHTFGYMSQPDYEYPPACMIMWGANPTATEFPDRQRILNAIKRGTKLIVIDPAETGLSRQADIWIKPRPLSDLALALGMINVIIEEELYDHEFVGKWTAGFDKLREHVIQYSPEKVSEITWVPAASIRSAARLYASNHPAVLYSGNGQDNNVNNFQFSRAASILRALTGNLGIPGGDILFSLNVAEPGGSPELHQRDALPPELRKKRIGAEENVLPTYFSALPQKLVKAMLTSQPYPIRSVFIQGGNLLATYSNTREVYRALQSLDFLAVSDLFLTPTAELADIVLPVATYLEMDDIHSRYATGVIQQVVPAGECWSDRRIINELGKSLGLGKHFWENESQILEFLIKPAGITFDEFRKIGFIRGKNLYREYEKKGFNTPSGKVELYSEQLGKWGFDPLPVFHEPVESPFSSPELFKEYPLIMTNSKVYGYVHSGGRQLDSIRRLHPDPLVTINSKTARGLGIDNGDWVYIENRRGKIKQKAHLSNSIDPRVIITEHGWWYPEERAAAHGWDESNINILTDNNPPYARELGSVTLRGILCKVYKEDL